MRRVNIILVNVLFRFDMHTACVCMESVCVHGVHTERLRCICFFLTAQQSLEISSNGRLVNKRPIDIYFYSMTCVCQIVVQVCMFICECVGIIVFK